MIKRVDGHPDRAAPVGVAAEHSGVGFGGQVGHPVVLAADTEQVRMALVVPRQGADAMSTEEFPLIEHRREHPAQLVFVQDRCEQAAADPALRRVLNEPRQLRTGVEKAAQTCRQVRVPGDHRPLEYRDGAEREETNHRAYFQPLRASARPPQHVVEEAVLLVPHADVLAGVNHRRRDPEVVFDELDAHVGVRRPLERQFPAYFEHVLAEERHPGGTVGLFQVAAGRQRGAAIEHADVVEAEEAAFEHVVPRAILPVHPPGEIEQELVEDALEPFDIAVAPARFVQSVGKDRSPTRAPAD